MTHQSRTPFLFGVIAYGAASLAAPAALAQPTLQTIIAFDGANGSFPEAGLVIDSAGDIFGTTLLGGPVFGNGTLFELAGPDHAKLRTLVAFDGSNGALPDACLVIDQNGSLYGTTASGGATGNGTVFRLSGLDYDALTTLASFDGGDGAGPTGVVMLGTSPLGTGSGPAASGNLFGLTDQGGASGDGAAFELSGPGLSNLTLLRSFQNAGQFPEGQLVADAVGNLYGVTEGGGQSGGGTMFELSGLRHTTRTVLASLPAVSSPVAGLTFDAAGNLFGVSANGGQGGGGRIFELSGTAHRTMTTLAEFGLPDDPNGSSPEAPLLVDARGNLHGTLTNGGPNGQGTVFRLSADHQTFTVLHAFTGGADGGASTAPLVADRLGNLYGTTTSGGAGGGGTVFKLTGTGFVPPR